MRDIDRPYAIRPFLYVRGEAIAAVVLILRRHAIIVEGRFDIRGESDRLGFGRFGRVLVMLICLYVMASDRPGRWWGWLGDGGRLGRKWREGRRDPCQ